jgi:hypothetical protein
MYILEHLNEENIKKSIKECKELIQTVHNKNSNRYNSTKQFLQDMEFNHYIQKMESGIFNKPPKPTIQIVDTFENWLTTYTTDKELAIFLYLSNQYFQSEQVYYGKQLILEYTKYVNECSKQLIIPSSFPNIEVINRTCESIKLDNGIIIKNPNYIPEPKESSFCFCCFS